MNIFVILCCISFVSLTIQGIGKDFSMIKELDDVIYVGGKNSLSSYKYDGEKLELIAMESYLWPTFIINGSDIGYDFTFSRWPLFIPNISKSFIFDTCLNWKQEHSDESERANFLDYHHWQYHTPSGDWQTMNYTCMNSFIKSVETLNNDTLWVCGTFGAFPRAFSVNKTDLKFIEFLDVNMMSCARYMDEPMATYRDASNNLYVASGWGLYRPDKKDPDVPNNNSTMLYADWRLFRNLFTLPAAMAWVLSSDVNFINVVKETTSHLYFFGHEINNQYGLNNQEDRHAWQSFMLRICKNDLGFKYVPTDISSLLKHMSSTRYYIGTIKNKDYLVSLDHNEIMSEKWYQNTVHLPTKHFVNPLKLNFGCYIGKRMRAISDNHFWGDTNVVYINKIADVIFNPDRSIKFQTKNNNEYFGCSNESHSQLPLIGIFNDPGLSETQVKPVGALCQLQINSNIFNEIGSNKKPYHKTNSLNVRNAYEEIMAISSTSYSNFYSRTMHRTNGFTLYPYWNQGVFIGDNERRPYYKNVFDDVGKCQNESFYKNIANDKFLKIQNFSNTAWPNELPNRLSSITSAICQFSAVELYSFNATFLIPGVEFKRIFILKENHTNYHMNKLQGESDEECHKRQRTSPLMITVILSNTGVLYRVVLCDFDSAMESHGINKTKNEWYNWCIFRHTDQPYLYRQYAPMENRKHGESYQYRASSLLMEKKIVKKIDSLNFPNNRDPQFHVVKDVLRQENILHVVTANNIYPIDIQIKCDTYSKCIDCASDPICMWHITSHKCVNYDMNKYRNVLFVQDVLDRGFRCAAFIKDKSHAIKISTVIMFHCSNGDYWRDQIVWRLNGIEVDVSVNKGIYLHKDNSIMTISDYTVDKYGTNISCHGIKDDHDKLFGGVEYDWSIESSEILLNTFNIQPIIIPEIRNPWKLICIISILAALVMFIWILAGTTIKERWMKLNKYLTQKKNNKINKSKQEINGTCPILFVPDSSNVTFVKEAWK